MRTDLAEDPAVLDMAARLGIDEFGVVGRLHAFWSWVDRQSRDGHARVTHAWLDRYVQTPGFAAAMVAVEWLIVDENKGLTIPNFDRHNGQTAKTRALAANRKRSERVRNVTPNVTLSSRSQRDESVTREEKRREEKKKETPSESPKKAARHSAKEAVESFKVDDPMRAFASRFGIDADAEFDSWLDHFRATGYRTRTGPVLDAAATFRTWIRNAQKFAASGQLVRRAPRPSQQPVEMSPEYRELQRRENERAKGSKS